MITMNIAIIGLGNVGSALAEAALAAGHAVTAVANPTNPEGAARRIADRPELSRVRIAPPADAFADADLAVLALPFAAAGGVLAGYADQLGDTVVIDATNPVGPGLTHGLKSKTSGTQYLAEFAPETKLVKAFTVYGFENLAHAPVGPGGQRSVMPYAGDDAAAKSRVHAFIGSLGWEPLDVGGANAALDLEHQTLLWVRMVRVGGLDPHLTYAVMGPQAGASTA